MSDIVARCTACGYEQPTTFPRCPVCGGTPAGWWCVPCHDWRPSQLCSACSGFLLVPPVIELGSFPAGSRIAVNFRVRNPGKKPIEFTVYPDGDELAFPSARRTVRAGESVEVHGTLALGEFAPGRRTYAVRFEAPVPAETTVAVQVVPAVRRLEFAPAGVAFASVVPGKLLRRNLQVTNTGNVAIAAELWPSAAWLEVTPRRIELGPGGSATLKLTAKTRKTDHGDRTALVRAVAGGSLWEARVRVQFPEPDVEAAPVDLGTVRPGRAAYESVTLRNVGKVRVACDVAADAPWLAVTPKRVNLPPGGEKVVKVRALVTEEKEGSCEAGVIVTLDGRRLLRVPVTAVCHVPKSVLGPIRRQTLGAVASDLPAVRRFRVANTGDGRLDCTVTADVSWVMVLTPTLKVGPRKRRRVEFRIDAPSMPLGTSVGTIRVRTNGGDADVPLSVAVVEPRPELEVLGDAELASVSADGSATGHLAVRNVGVGLLRLRAEPGDTRVSVTPAEATLSPGPPTRLAVSVSVEGLAGGTHAFGVRVTSNGGEGRAEVRFRLPVELLDLPSMIDLGDRPAGRPADEALRVRNVGPDPVELRVRAEDPWVRPGAERIVVPPGQMTAVPFRLDLAQGVFGPVASIIRVEGRTARFAVAVRVVARRAELVAVPDRVDLGGMLPGQEREFTFRVENRGELAADVRESHTPGELEVWVRRHTVQPGTTAVVPGRVRMNAKGAGRRARATAPVTDETVVRFDATVARPLTPRILAAVAVAGGVAVGGVLGATVGWLFGAAVAVAGIVACVLLVVNEAP